MDTDAAVVWIQTQCWFRQGGWGGRGGPYPGGLQVVLKGLADHPGVLHGDGRPREVLVPHFGLGEKNTKKKVYAIENEDCEFL